MKNQGLHKMVQASLIAALYAALTLAVAPIAFGAVQFRISELLTVLPLFTATAIPGLTLGCALANFVGFLLGINGIGIFDVFFGTAATLLASLVTYWIGKQSEKPLIRSIFGPLPPVLFNAVIVGAELTILFAPSFTWPLYWLNFGSVLVGELVICYLLGVPLILLLNRKQFYRKIFG